MIEGYTPDSVVMAKDLYRAAYKGAVLAPSFAINAKFIEGVGTEVAEGVWNMDRAPLFDSPALDRKSTRLNSSHGYISYAVFCLKKKKKILIIKNQTAQDC